MSRASRKANRESAIRANNSKVSRRTEKDIPVTQNRRREETQKILEKWGYNKYAH